MASQKVVEFTSDNWQKEVAEECAAGGGGFLGALVRSVPAAWTHHRQIGHAIRRQSQSRASSTSMTAPTWRRSMASPASRASSSSRVATSPPRPLSELSTKTSWSRRSMACWKVKSQARKLTTDNTESTDKDHKIKCKWVAGITPAIIRAICVIRGQTLFAFLIAWSNVCGSPQGRKLTTDNTESTDKDNKTKCNAVAGITPAIIRAICVFRGQTPFAYLIARGLTSMAVLKEENRPRITRRARIKTIKPSAKGSLASVRPLSVLSVLSVVKPTQRHPAAPAGRESDAPVGRRRRAAPAASVPRGQRRLPDACPCGWSAP